MVTKEETAVIVSPKGNLPQSLSPDSTIHASSTNREGNASILPEKPSEDGYNWRKYGQKNVKGNEYIRSYYKCSHPNCLVKKQVERSHDGRITDITYLGNHDHAKPHSDSQVTVPSLLSVKVQIPDCPPSGVDEDKTFDSHSPATDRVQKMDVCEDAIVKTTDDTPPACITPLSQAKDDHSENFTLKRRKKGIDGADSITEKPNHESRVVVHTVSEVDIVNDGYRWRKYGQKMVKGNPNPRSYYRCSTTGCPVKKHVERASHDPKVVITTYEGQHDHSVPPIRTIVPQAVAAYAGGTESNGLTKSKSEERDAAVDSAIVLHKPENAEVVHQPEKDNSVGPTTTTEQNHLAIVVKAEDATTESTSTADRTDHIPQTTKEIDMGIQVETKLEMTSQQQNPTSECIDPTAKQEKVASPQVDRKPEVVSTESSRAEVKSNGLQRPNAEAVNC
ncbi:putative WRKY transcription factor 20 [Bienertia sinuspersici]